MTFTLVNTPEGKDTPLKKNTNNDKRSIIGSALRQAFVPVNGYDTIYLYDFDDTYVYFEVYDYETSAYEFYRTTYTYNETSATFGEDLVPVVATTTFKEVEEVKEASLEKTILSTLKKFFGPSSRKDQEVIKQFDEEKMIAVEPLYILPDTVDGHGDTISLEETYKMVESFNKANDEGRLKKSLFHTHETKGFEILKAWVTEADCVIGETSVAEGQPVVKVHFLNKSLWEKRKTGELSGLSIGARAEFEELV